MYIISGNKFLFKSNENLINNNKLFTYQHSLNKKYLKDIANTFNDKVTHFPSCFPSSTT